MRIRLAVFAAIALLACAFSTNDAFAQKDEIGERLLAAAEGLQMPSSESDSSWSLVSYAGVEGLPEAETFGEMTGCSPGGATSSGFGETLDRLSKVEPWMDAGQVRSARGFRKLGKVFEHEFGDELAVYRCDTGGPEVNFYFVGVEDERLLGLVTVSIET